MGCDIHAHLEVKINGTWHHYSNPPIHRYYALFERLAGVRGAVEKAIAPPRGLPDDLTFLTQFDYIRVGSDAHTPSWINSVELGELITWVDEQQKARNPDRFYSWECETLGYLFGNGWDILKYPGDHPKGVEDARMVFWFDN